MAWYMAAGSLYAKDNSQVIPEVVCIPLELHNTALESGTMFEESSKLHDTKKSLHLLLKPELQKLCELLNLSVCITFLVKVYGPS